MVFVSPARTILLITIGGSAGFVHTSCTEIKMQKQMIIGNGADRRRTNMDTDKVKLMVAATKETTDWRGETVWNTPTGQYTNNFDLAVRLWKQFLENGSCDLGKALFWPYE